MKEKVRQSNFELMRVISMFFIVVYHMIVPTGGNLINNTAGMTNIIIDLISLLIIVHVNSFILITGYFQSQNKFSLKKLLSLVFMAWFYKIIIACISFVIGIHQFNSIEIVTILSPFEFANNWFLVVYMSLYLISPYINILLNKLNQKEHRKLVILLFLMFSLLPTITNQNTFNNTGFTIVHFVYLYILGAYLRKYPISENIHFKNFSKKKKGFLFFGLYLFLGIFNFLLYEFCEQVLLINNNELLVYVCNSIKQNLFFYQTPILIIQSISYFLFFETISFSSKWINKLAIGTFSIYIITENPYVKNWLYPFLGIEENVLQGAPIIPKIMIYSIGIMLICLIIENIRQLIIKWIKITITYFRRKKNPTVHTQ